VSLVLSGDGAITGAGAISGITSLNTDVSSTELGYLDGVTSGLQGQINTAGGLVLITSESFSAVSSVSVDECFTSTYLNYLLVIESAGSQSQNITYRHRASGSDISLGNYQTVQNRILANAATSLGSQQATNSGTNIVLNDGITQLSATINLFRPQASAITLHNALGSSWIASEASRWHSSGIYNATTSIDGFSIIASAGTMSGTVRIYGYRNS
jgi:hypothetical protein